MRKYLGIIGIFIICVISFGTFFGLARGTLNDIAGFGFQTVNEANYIKVDDYTLQNIEDDASIKVIIDEDGIITFDGKNDTDDTIQFVVTTLSLEAGEYEFTSNTKGCSEDTYQVILKDSEDGVIIADETFTVEETTTYTVIVEVYADAKIDTKVAPTIVDEGEKTGFFVNNWNPFKK